MPDHLIDTGSESPIVLTQCGICDIKFDRSLSLSQHLNSHGIEWKAYWDMYLHHVSELTCNLCSATHRDVYSLESHLKMTHCIRVGVESPHSAPASPSTEHSGTNSVPLSRGIESPTEALNSRNLNRPQAVAGDGRKSQNVRVVEVNIPGTSASRGLGAASRAGASRSFVIGRAARGAVRKLVPAGTDHLASVLFNRSRINGSSNMPPDSGIDPSTSRIGRQGDVETVPITSRGDESSIAAIPVPKGVQHASDVRRAGVPPTSSFPGPSMPQNARPGTALTPTTVPARNAPPLVTASGRTVSSAMMMPGRTVQPSLMVPSGTVVPSMMLSTGAAVPPGSAEPPMQTPAGVALPLMTMPLGSTVPPMVTKGRITSITPGSGKQGIPPAGLSPPTVDICDETTEVNEITEVGRVVTVPLDGAPAGRLVGATSASSSRTPRKRRASANSALDIIEVVDFGSSTSASTAGRAPVGSSNPLSSERLRPTFHDKAMMSAGSRTIKPTAVVLPYESERERSHQRANLSESRGSSSGSEVRPLMTFDCSQTSPGHWGQPLQDTRGPACYNVPAHQSSTAPIFTEPMTTPSADARSSVLQMSASPPTGSPAKHNYSAISSSKNPVLSSILASTKPRSQHTTSIGSSSAPAVSPTGLQPVSQQLSATPALDTAVQRAESAPHSAAPDSGAASKPALLPWLDPVYRPGTLTRLGEQAAALTRRPESPSRQPSSAETHGKLRRYLDRSQQLDKAMVEGESGDQNMPLLRLQAAAESDQQTAVSGSRPTGTTPASGALAGRRARRGPARGRAASAVRQPQALSGDVGQPPELSPQPLPDAQHLTMAELAGGAPTSPTPPVLEGAGMLADAPHTEQYHGEDSLQAGITAANLKTEPCSPIKVQCKAEMSDDESSLTFDGSVKEEPVSFHHSVGIDSGPSMEQPPMDDSSEIEMDIDDPPLAVKIETFDVKTEPVVEGVEDGGPVKLEGEPSSPPVTFGSPGAAGQDDPLSVKGDVTLAVIDPEEMIDEPPSPSPPAPAPAARGRRGPGRPSRAAAGGEAAAGGRPGAPAGGPGSSAARQDTAGRRRRKKHKWYADKKRKGNKPLFQKPVGTGDGEIDPGNTVEVLFLNDEDGQENYDAMDAMVMKVDTEVRPTRYYVHFNDTSHRHDRWVTRPDISRVYRSQLRPLRTVPALPTPAPAPAPAPAPSSAQPAETTAADTAGQGRGVGEPPEDGQSAVAGPTAGPPAAKTTRRKRVRADSGASSGEPPASGTEGPERPAEDPGRAEGPGLSSRGPGRPGRGSARRGRRPGRGRGRGGQDRAASPAPPAAPTVRRLAFVPPLDRLASAKSTEPMRPGRLVQVVYEVTADGAQLICPAKIVRVDAALSYRRYLVRYLGWLRRYREWVTDAVIRCPPAPLKHNSGGQILLRSVLPPPDCPESSRAAYSALRPCSVDLSAGNLFFLSATRPLPHLVNDPRIAAGMAALRPRRDDEFGSRTDR